MLIAAYQYSLPLVQPLTLAHGKLYERQGILLKFQSGDQINWGEAAPLPGFSRESLDDIRQLILSGSLLGSSPIRGATPASLQFALKMGMQPLQPSPMVRSATLMTQTTKTPPKGITKLKVGRISVIEELSRFKQLQQAFPKALWRLDGNRLWTIEQALTFVEGLSDFERQRILFVEEPCQTEQESLAFSQVSGLPIALDETLQNPAYQPQLFTGLRALVCKPTLMGLERCAQLQQFAQGHQLEFIISGAFESNLTHSYLNSLANQWAPDRTHGLDTLSSLAADLISPRSPESTLPVLKEEDLELIWQC